MAPTPQTPKTPATVSYDTLPQAAKCQVDELVAVFQKEHPKSTHSQQDEINYAMSSSAGDQSPEEAIKSSHDAARNSGRINKSTCPRSR